MVDALGAAGALCRCLCPSATRCSATPLKGPFPGWGRDGSLRHGLLLGRRADLLAGRRRLQHRCRLRGRLHAQPDLRGGVQRHDRPRRGRAGRLRHRQTSYQEMLQLFWEGHDPTQGMRQGNDVGSQYRSAIYWQGDAQQTAAEASRDAYQQVLSAAGHGQITTEIAQARPVLLRRGLPPAVPGQEPWRLLRPGRHGRGLPGRPHHVCVAQPNSEGSPMTFGRADCSRSQMCDPAPVRAVYQAAPS